MGGTDCALPMIWARRHKLRVSGFITYTSETWAGDIHPSQALRRYWDEFVSDAKAVVVGMTSNGFTLADPNDRGMLGVVGFDATAPARRSETSAALGKWTKWSQALKGWKILLRLEQRSTAIQSWLLLRLQLPIVPSLNPFTM